MPGDLALIPSSGDISIATRSTGVIRMARATDRDTSSSNGKPSSSLFSRASAASASSRLGRSGIGGRARSAGSERKYRLRPVVAGRSQQRAVRAQCRAGDDTSDDRERPVATAGEQDVHDVIGRVAGDQLLLAAVALSPESDRGEQLQQVGRGDRDQYGAVGLPSVGGIELLFGRAHEERALIDRHSGGEQCSSASATM